MWRTFKKPEFTKGLYYDGPVSLWFAIIKIFTAAGYRYSIRKNGRPIGRIWLIERKGKWRLGYWLAPKYHGKGYMIEAVAALMKVAPILTNSKTITAECHTWNSKSRAVLIANSFHPVGFEEDREQFEYIVSANS
jgi:RimJ/RimL family protein N-acetyltransferase